MNTKVAIIGGGFSGLYSLKYCIQEGLDCKLFESSDSIGGVWKYREEPGGVFKNTYVSSSLNFLHPTDYPFSKETPHFPHHSIIYKHLLDYAKNFDLNKHIVLNTPVKKTIKDDKKWVVYYDKDNKEISEKFDKVIVCTGIHQIPKLVKDDNILKKFQNQDNIIHSHYYEQNKDKFKDKNILIIGGGETAHDIAVDLANISKKVYMSIRNGQWFQGKLLGGNEPADLQFNRLMNLIWYKPYSNLISWMNSQIWGYGGSGIKKWYPTSGYFDSFFTKGREIFLWISKGKIIPCGGITNIEKDMIYFDDKEENIDYIILCTGYENSHLKTLLPNVEFDKNNFKLIFDPDDTSLSYCGFVRPVITSIPLICELQARLISKVYSEKIKLPKFCDMIIQIESDVSKRKKIYAKDYERLKYIVNSYNYCDEIAILIGCKPNLWKLFFTNHNLWRMLVIFPWNQFQYTCTSTDDKVRKIAIERLEEIRDSHSGQRLKVWANVGLAIVGIILILILGILVGIIFGFVKAGPYIVHGFSILLLLLVPV